MLKKALFSFLTLLFPFAVHADALPDQNSGIEQTLSIIKPDAVKANHIGGIIERLEQNGLRIGAIKMIQLTKPQAMNFYQEHRGKPFYESLAEYMSSGPVVVMVLEGPDAIKKNREVMGATDPQQAKPGTIRRDFALSKQSNAVHGSDSKESAKREIGFFFNPQNIFPRF